MTIRIECKDLEKKFDDLEVISKLDFKGKKGEFIVLLGPSGCGKSTVLSLMAGFEKPTEGKVLIDGKPLKKPSRRIGFVFQDYALFPWKTVLGNVMSGLEGFEDKEERAKKYVKLVGLEEFMHEYPHKLSGGMKQRVGIARALAYDPEILLMDEPFGALDAQTRKIMQHELLRILKGMDKTVVFVTHSVIEAVYLADRVIVLSKRPAKIIYEEKINIEGERSSLSQEFLKYREKILHHLNQEIGLKE